MTDVQPLVQHLRQYPRDIHRNPADLAALLGLDVNLVARTLAHLSDLPAHTQPTPMVKRQVAEEPTTNRLIAWFSRVFREGADHFWVSVLILGLSIVVLGGLRLILALVALEVLQPLRYVFAALQLVALGSAFGLIFQRAQLRCALGGSAVIAAAFAINGGWDRTPSLSYNFASVGILFLLLLMPFIIGAIPISIFGGYARLRRDQRRLENMTRQDSIGRLLDLRKSVEAMTSDTPSEPTWVEAWSTWVAPRAVILTVSAATVQHIVTTILGMIFDPESKITSGDQQVLVSFMWLALVMLLLSALTFLFLFGVGLLSRTIGRAAVAGIAFVGANICLMFIPVGPYSFHAMGASKSGASGAGYLVYFGAIVAGAIAAMLDAQSNRQKRVTENDPSALIAEMIHLEWKLRPRVQSVCVLVVDASKSSEMKAAADPFEAEWSFREYQKFLEDIAVENRGLVHSTAGDGAVIGFSSCQDALKAGQEIHAKLEVFNQTVNRLKTPFRLRIGIHAGEIQGALDQVEFTEVIDIAAHIEGAAPIGGIAVSEVVLKEISGVHAHSLDRMVDGYKVFTVGGPTFAL